jgi:carbon monoxide dehydrogenase subunit G
MELKNEFRVDAPIDAAWATLTDVEGIAPCMPGAQLTEIEGDEFKGSVKVKVGPITAQYKGAAKFLEKDDAAYKAVIEASGRDTRGAGNASAIVTMQLTADGDGTSASIVTDLKVTGKVAQFGRGVMADVSEKLLGQFVDCLAAKLATAGSAGEQANGDAPHDTVDGPDTEAPAVEAPKAAPTGPRKINMPEAKPVDLLDTAGAPVLKRAAPAIAVLLLLLLLVRRLRK